jgi:hypothetical protein
MNKPFEAELRNRAQREATIFFWSRLEWRGLSLLVEGRLGVGSHPSFTRTDGTIDRNTTCNISIDTIALTLC